MCACVCVCNNIRPFPVPCRRCSDLSRCCLLAAGPFLLSFSPSRRLFHVRGGRCIAVETRWIRPISAAGSLKRAACLCRALRCFPTTNQPHHLCVLSSPRVMSDFSPLTGNAEATAFVPRENFPFSFCVRRIAVDSLWGRCVYASCLCTCYNVRGGRLRQAEAEAGGEREVRCVTKPIQPLAWVPPRLCISGVGKGRRPVRLPLPLSFQLACGGERKGRGVPPHSGIVLKSEVCRLTNGYPFKGRTRTNDL